MLNAVRLMYVGAALSLVSFLAGLLSLDEIREATRETPGLTPEQADMAVTIGIVFAVLLGLIGAGLWILMALMNKRGHNWARIVATVLFALNTLGLLSQLTSDQTAGLSKILGAVVWLVGLGAIIFLWSKDSSAYFKAPQRPAGY